MRFRRVQLFTLITFALSGVAIAVADEPLKDFYAAVLRGEIDAGAAALARTDDQSSNAPVERAKGWLNSYRQVVDSRDELRQKTFEWNMQEARKAFDEGKTYIALSFAAQASRYADDPIAFARDPWVLSVRAKALELADGFMKDSHWSKALSCYFVWLRIDEKDDAVDALRKKAVRHARVEALYKNDEDVQRRMKGVQYGLLDTAIQLVNDSYYERPDFNKMAEGALDNLTVLCETPKIYDASSAFHGVANPVTRKAFLDKLEALRGDVKARREYTHKDLIRLFRDIRSASRDSVSLPEELLIMEFMEGALGVLDDFTSIVWPVDAPEFDKYMVGSFYGVGIQLGVDELTNRLKVMTPLENSPALRAGIQPDDLIIEVDGVSTHDWTTDRAVREITGMEGTVVRLNIFRPRTGETIQFPLKRSRIQLTTVRGVNRLDDKTGEKWNYMLDKDAGIAYARLTGFTESSKIELEEALNQAKQQGMKGLVLDLRYNPGGLLDVAVDIVSLFLKEGEIVWTKGRREEPDHHRASGDHSFADLPLIVLVNDGSASASEIFAGAMQDHNRAVILGERTFGKGSVQRVLRLDRRFTLDSAAPSAKLKLTTALYYLPSNRSPHRLPDSEVWGVDPDWSLKLTPKELTKLLKRQNDLAVIHNETGDAPELDEATRKANLESIKSAGKTEDEDGDEPLLTEEDIKLLRADPYEAPDTDAQLEAALLQMRVKLAADMPWPTKLARGGASEAAHGGKQ